MKSNLQFESVGLKGTVKNVPETFEDVKALGIPEATFVGLAVDYVMFHRILGDFRSDLMDAVIESTGVEPKTKDKDGAKPDEKGNVAQVLDEKPAIYLARAAAETGKKVTDFQELADAICNSTDGEKYSVYDFPKFTEERVRQPKLEYTKGDLELAKQIVAYDEAKRANAFAKLSTAAGVEVNASTPIEDIAKAIKAFRTAQLNALK